MRSAGSGRRSGEAQPDLGAAGWGAPAARASSTSEEQDHVECPQGFLSGVEGGKLSVGAGPAWLLGG